MRNWFHIPFRISFLEGTFRSVFAHYLGFTPIGWHNFFPPSKWQPELCSLYSVYGFSFYISNSISKISACITMRHDEVLGLVSVCLCWCCCCRLWLWRRGGRAVLSIQLQAWGRAVSCRLSYYSTANRGIPSSHYAGETFLIKGSFSISDRLGEFLLWLKHVRILKKTCCFLILSYIWVPMCRAVL